jgi:hypothetical protein
VSPANANKPQPPGILPGEKARQIHALRVLFIFIFLFSFSLNGIAQQARVYLPEASPDGLESDTLSKQKRIPSPGRAAMLSATLPGLGQAYNRAYWKIPIIYAGFGGVVYAVNFNNTEYQAWRKAYFAKVDGNPNTIDEYPLYSDASLRRAMEYYRRNLELTYIVGVALYLLNILDANVQAHLMDFDVSEDLSMRVEPKMLPINPLAGPIGHAPGIKLSFRF